MRYRIANYRGGRKDVIWDIEETHDINRFPTFAEIIKAAAEEFPEISIKDADLVIIPAGSGDMIVLRLKRYANQPICP